MVGLKLKVHRCLETSFLFNFCPPATSWCLSVAKINVCWVAGAGAGQQGQGGTICSVLMIILCCPAPAPGEYEIADQPRISHQPSQQHSLNLTYHDIMGSCTNNLSLDSCTNIRHEMIHLLCRDRGHRVSCPALHHLAGRRPRPVHRVIGVDAVQVGGAVEASCIASCIYL